MWLTLGHPHRRSRSELELELYESPNPSPLLLLNTTRVEYQLTSNKISVSKIKVSPKSASYLPPLRGMCVPVCTCVCMGGYVHVMVRSDSFDSLWESLGQMSALSSKSHKGLTALFPEGHQKVKQAILDLSEAIMGKT